METAEVMTALFDRWDWQLPPSDTRWCSIRCGHHDDHNASARVYMEQGAFICLACDLKAGKPVNLLMAVEGLPYREARIRLDALGLSEVKEPEVTGPKKPWKGRKGGRSWRQQKSMT
jgi:DNA primase